CFCLNYTTTMIHSRNKILNTATTVAVAACTQHRHHSFYRCRTPLSGSSTLLCFFSAPANYS
ncbi:hypothetical protein S83_028022, partial [Arachis hypogaea]